MSVIDDRADDASVADSGVCSFLLTVSVISDDTALDETSESVDVPVTSSFTVAYDEAISCRAVEVLTAGSPLIVGFVSGTSAD